jgi:hypothetical protein
MRRNLSVSAFVGAMVLAAAVTAQAQQINHPAGFTGQTDLTLTNNASVTGTGRIQLTPAVNNNLGSVFTTVKVPINQFSTVFDFHILGTAGGMADGMGFCIQNISNTTVGAGGGGMGFSGMAAPSMFIKFDCYNNVSTTKLTTNGGAPDDTASTDLRALGIDWHTQHDFRCTMTYNGTAISMTLQDLTTMATNTQTFTIDLVTLMGAGTAFVGFTGATGGLNANQELLNWVYSSLPAPTNLTATAGFNQVVLNWTAAAGATSYNVLRSATPGGSYSPIANVSGTTYTDTGVTYPNTYYYVVQSVQGTITSLYSNEASCTPLQPPLSVDATTIQTLEGGAPVIFHILINQPLTTGNTITFTVTSNVGAEGQVSALGQPPAPAPSAATITFTVTGPQVAGTSIPVTVYGMDDSQADGPQAYTVTVSFTSTQTAPFSGFTIPVINCTNNDNDTPGVTVSRTAGLLTSESGGAATFTVVLNTQPTAPVTLTLTSSNVLEGTVSPGTLTFTTTGGQLYNSTTGSGGWNQGHIVTVTGVDDAALDFTVPYTIVTADLSSADPKYNGMGVPDVACDNLDNEVPPELPAVWGNGGCGLLGLEGLLVLALVGLRRRR